MEREWRKLGEKKAVVKLDFDDLSCWEILAWSKKVKERCFADICSGAFEAGIVCPP